MDHATLDGLGVVANSIIAVFCVLALPFVIRLSNKITAIETTLNTNTMDTSIQFTEISKLKDSITEIRLKLASCPGCTNIKNGD